MRKLLFLSLALVLLSCKSENKKDKEDLQSTPTTQADLPPEVKENIDRGASIYNNFCVTCHLSSGEGVANAFPPLNNSNWLKEKREASIRAVKFGLKGPIEVNGEDYNSLMADPGLTDQEVADVMNYIFTAWDNNIGPPVTLEEVEELEE